MRRTGMLTDRVQSRGFGKAPFYLPLVLAAFWAATRERDLSCG